MITIKNYEMGGAAWGMQKHTTLFASGVRNVTLSADELSAPAHDASCARMTFRPRSSVGPESAPVKNLANILTFFWREVLPPISHFLISSFVHNGRSQARGLPGRLDSLVVRSVFECLAPSAFRIASR